MFTFSPLRSLLNHKLCNAATYKKFAVFQPVIVRADKSYKALVKSHFKKNEHQIVESMMQGLDKLKGPLYRVKVFTDNQSMIATYFEGKTQFASVYSTDHNTVSKLLNSPNIINPNRNAIIRSNFPIKDLVNYPLMELPKLTRYVRHLGTLEERCLPEGLQFGNIQLSDLDLIVSKWHCKTWPGSRELLHHFITTYPNVGIYDMSSTYPRPRLVSWALSSGLGIINHLYIMKEYSGQGLAAAISRRITNELLYKGYTPQGDVGENNALSNILADTCGYNKSCSLFVNLK